MRTLPAIDTVSALIAEVAAAEILPRFRALGDGAIRTKTHAGDLVTDADEAAERVLAARLTDLLPGSQVVGEEAAYATPALLDSIAGEDWVWIIDPVDGTSNFAHGRPVFATIIALTHRGRTVRGWIHDPINGRTATAEAGGGAWLDGARLAVSAGGRPPAVLVATLGLRTPKGLSAAFSRVIRHGSAAHDYLALASGTVDVGVYRRLMPWDHAAGVLIHAEAGGHAALAGDGSPYAPTRHAGSLLLAPDRDTWTAVRRLLDAHDLQPPSAGG